MNDQEIEVQDLTEIQIKALEVFESQGANVTAACKAVGISRQTFYHWSDNSDTYKRKVHEIRESMIDFAESSLKKQIKDGNTSATIFFLKTIGKSRGYIERQEIKHSGGIESDVPDTVKDTMARIEAKLGK